MHLIQLLCERRYMQIHISTCRYNDICITYTSCICGMDCVLSCAYAVHMQAVYPSHTYTYINPYALCMYIHICIGRITDAGGWAGVLETWSKQVSLSSRTGAVTLHPLIPQAQGGQCKHEAVAAWEARGILCSDKIQEVKGQEAGTGCTSSSSC